MSSSGRAIFSFEKSAVRLNDGTHIQLMRDCERCWIQDAPASYRILGTCFKVLYQLNAGGYAILDFTSDRKQSVKTSEGDAELWSTDGPPLARRVSDDEAVDFLISAHFEIPEHLHPVLDRKSKEARKPAETKPPRRLEYWVEKSPHRFNANQPADPPRALETTDSIIELAEIAVQTVRCWPNQSWHERDHLPLRALGNWLFSRFRVDPSDWWGPKDCVPPEYVDLLELRWPDGSEELRQTLVEMREIIAAPVAVLIAARFTLGHPDAPTAEEREAAESALIEPLGPLEQAVVRLRADYGSLKSGANLSELRKHPVSRKPPSDNAMLAYRVWALTGLKQQQIAEILATRHGITADQGTVSRWLREVKEWLELGKVLTEISWTTAKKVQSIDPAEIDKGAHLEGRTPRQRRRILTAHDRVLVVYHSPVMRALSHSTLTVCARF